MIERIIAGMNWIVDWPTATRFAVIGAAFLFHQFGLHNDLQAYFIESGLVLPGILFYALVIIFYLLNMLGFVRDIRNRDDRPFWPSTEST